MRKNIKKVIEAFELRRKAVGDSRKTCRTDGKNIYSYKLLIVKRHQCGRISILPRSAGPSKTTRSQIDACWEYFSRLAVMRRQEGPNTLPV